MGFKLVERIIQFVRGPRIPQPPEELEAERDRLRSAVQQTVNIAGALEHTARNAAARNQAFQNLMTRNYEDIEARLRRRKSS